MPSVPRRTVFATACALALMLVIGPPLVRGAVDSVRPEPEPLVTQTLERLRTEDPNAVTQRAPEPETEPTTEPGNDSPAAGAPEGLAGPVVFDGDVDRRLGRIGLPGLDVQNEFASGVYDEILEDGPGHWPGTPLPTQAGNAVLSGHRTTFTAPFADIDLLEAGDEVTAGLGPFDDVTYRVTSTEIVPEEEYVDVILEQPDDPSARVLTLFACHPKGQRTHRIVVTAEADPVPPAEADAPDQEGSSTS